MTTALIAVVVFILSLAGGYAPRLLEGRFGRRGLENLTAIASGILLTSALLIVVPEGFHVASESVDGDDAFIYEPVVLGAAVLAGFALMLLLEGFGVGHAVHEEHHDHAEGHGHGHVHHPTSSTVLAIGLTVHAAADGLAIGSAAATGEATFSFLVAFAVLLHRAPAAFSLGVFALHERSRAAAARALWMFAIASPVAILIAFVALDNASEGLVALALLFSAGTFVYVATVDTLPAIHNPDIGRRLVRNVILGGLVFAVLLLIVRSTGVLEHGH